MKSNSVIQQELTQIFKENHLFDTQRFYYTPRVILYSLILFSCFYALPNIQTLSVLILSAIIAGVANMQLGTIAHDISHGAVPMSRNKTAKVSLFLWNLLLGVSFSWWIDKHHRHHTQPNIEVRDPDLYLLLCYTSEEALRKKGFLGFAARHQVFFYPIFAGLFYFYFLYFSLVHVITKPLKYKWSELLFLIIHYSVLFGAIFSNLPIIWGILFYFVFSMVTSYYMVFIFSPNHMGMPILDEKTDEIGFKEQFYVTRNVHPSPFIDWFYSGLNYQIEHHLFEFLPRYQFLKASQLVKKYCAENSLPYHSLTTFETYKEIFKYLYDVGSESRKTRQTMQKSTITP